MDFGQHVIFKRNTMFLKPALFSFSGRKQSTTKVNRPNVIFWDFIHRLIYLQNMMIKKPAVSVCRHGSMEPTEPLFSITGHHRHV